MNLGGRTINPGDLRTPISFLRRTVVEDPGGAKSIVWVPFVTVWAKWTNSHGAAAVRQDADQVENTPTVLARYRSDVSPIHAVRKGTDTYEIVSPVDNILERGEYMEFTVRIMEMG